MSRTTSRGQVSVELLCETFHVSRQACYAARERPTPAPRRRPAPPGDFTPTPEAIEAIRRVCAAHTAWGVRKVWASLRREKLVVSRKRVWLLMATFGLLQQAVERRNEEPRGTVVVPTSNRRWATDLTTVWRRHGARAAPSRPKRAASLRTVVAAAPPPLITGRVRLGAFRAPTRRRAGPGGSRSGPGGGGARPLVSRC